MRAAQNTQFSPTLGSASRTACSTICVEGRAKPWRFPQFLSLPGRVRPRCNSHRGCLGSHPARGRGAPGTFQAAPASPLALPARTTRPPGTAQKPPPPLRPLLLSHARSSGLSFPVCAARCGRTGMGGSPCCLNTPNLFSPSPPSRDAPAEMRVLRAPSSGQSLHCTVLVWRPRAPFVN